MNLPVSPEVSAYVRDLTLVHEDEAVWLNGTMPLLIHSYITPSPPPTSFVSSVRGVVVNGSEVLVMHSQDDTHHVLPGGRREEGETLRDTLHRELIEETGFSTTCRQQVGVVHFHHRNPAPPDYKYPHPDFLWLVFRVDVEERVSESVIDDWEVDSFFRPVDQLHDLGLTGRDMAFVRAALAAN